MGIYTYLGYDQRGKKVKGTIEANSLDAARDRLQGKGIFVAELTPLNSSKNKSLFVVRVRSKELFSFFQQLGALLEAGLPLVKALGLIAHQWNAGMLKNVFLQIKQKVEEGHSFSNALAEYPHIFNKTMVASIKAGENSGQLDQVVQKLAESIEQELELKQRLFSALAYPCFLMVVGAGVIVFLLVYLVPKLSNMFKEVNRSLPLLTLILLKISKYWWLIGLSFALTGILTYFWLVKTHRLDRLKFVFPVVGSLYTKVVISRFARTMGLLLSNHVSVLNSLVVAKEVIANQEFVSLLKRVEAGIKQGQGLALELKKSFIFPERVIQMIAVGEESGCLGEMFVKIARLYDQELKTSLAAFMSLIEPVMILVLGSIVGFIVIAILLPIFELSTFLSP